MPQLHKALQSTGGSWRLSRFNGFCSSGNTSNSLRIHILSRRWLHSLKLTVSLHLKIGHPKRKRVFQPSIFRCYLSFREGTKQKSQTTKTIQTLKLSQILTLKRWENSETEIQNSENGLQEAGEIFPVVKKPYLL